MTHKLDLLAELERDWPDKLWVVGLVGATKRFYATCHDDHAAGTGYWLYTFPDSASARRFIDRRGLDEYMPMCYSASELMELLPRLSITGKSGRIYKAVAIVRGDLLVFDSRLVIRYVV